MFHSKGLRALGLAFVAALASMAFMVTGAQAEEGTLGEWLVLSPAKTLKELGIVSETFAGEQATLGTLLVPSKNLEVICHKGKVSGDILQSGHAVADVTFEECKAYEFKAPLTLLSKCIIVGGGVIKAKVLAHVRLYKSETLVLIQPFAGLTKEFTSVNFEAGKGCVLPLVNPVTGQVVSLPSQTNVADQFLDFSEAIQKMSLDKLLYGSGAAEAFIDAKAINLLLTGKELKAPWGVH